MNAIVIASSEHSIQEALRVLLGEEHILVPARTLPQLLNALVEHPVDIVIIDEFLENTDCVSVFQRMRTLSPDITCILLAVRTDTEMAREIRAKGVYDIVAKPFDKNALLAAVDRALERSHLRQRIAAAERAPAQMPPLPAVPGVPNGEASLAHPRELQESLRKFLKAVSDVLLPEKLHAPILDAVVEMFAINKAALLLHDEKSQQMRMKAAVGLDSAVLNGYGMIPWTGMISWLRKNDRILNLDDPELQVYSEEMLGIKKELDLLQGRICVPLVVRGRLMGVLVLGKKVTGRRLSDSELEFLYLLSQQIAAIIENAKQQQAVFVQKERFEEILQGVTSGLLATDSEGRLTIFNKAAEQILGLEAVEIMGQSVQRIGSLFADIVFRTLREGKAFHRHEMVYPPTKALLGISTSLLTDSEGKPIGAVVLFTDLSTVKKPAGDTDDTWERCALCLAQEIKNPLVAIRTFTQLFPESYADEKFRNEFSEIAIKEIDKLDGIVERLLRFSQPLEIKPESTDINSLLEEEIDRIVEKAKAQKVSVKKDFGTTNGRLLFDRNLLKEALGQIFHNALEAMPSGGTLTVSTATRDYPSSTRDVDENGIPPGPVTEISIDDTGIGITPEEMPILFKPFHTSKVKGMGLGLSISRRIVRGHHGDITVSSESNKGTSVKVLLPRGVAQNV